ncbi:hypothetical protein FOE78_11700 [Microlunatus elymi]|uniref:Antitoxin FitA-like ribbon-helix-helix domain-containing protein n=1 Tax=Microlunatus elymi TaxID=2596828 RepID=A0A516PZ70_9ACTN|nr:hypothetical protein [Microlunatus elymi]QDP96479.1 hypothetical protein FOE78_11700 [Microlunatus elymi]
MVNLQIRDVPEDVRDALAARARENAQSLNMFLRDVVLREAAFARNRILIDKVTTDRRSSGVTTEDVMRALDAGRRRDGA